MILEELTHTKLVLYHFLSTALIANYFPRHGSDVVLNPTPISYTYITFYCSFALLRKLIDNAVKIAIKGKMYANFHLECAVLFPTSGNFGVNFGLRKVYTCCGRKTNRFNPNEFRTSWFVAQVLKTLSRSVIRTTKSR